MRWKKYKEDKTDYNKPRTRKGFLFFPKCLNSEWRWLETACWTQRWFQPQQGQSRWEDESWVNPVVDKTGYIVATQRRTKIL